MATNNMNLTGEFYAMHRLFRQGYEPALTLGNTKGVDILLYNPRNKKQFKIEVKTTGDIRNEVLFGGRNINWWMNKKHETIVDSNLIYCFVHIPKETNVIPRIFFAPSKFVAKYVKEQHEIWLSSPHKKPVKNTPIRSFRILLNQLSVWENNFDIFE